MKRKTFVVVIILILLGPTGPYLAIQPAFSQSGKNFLWKIQSSTATVYLLGSIHFLKEKCYPLPLTVESAYDSSEVLVVEADINDIGKVDLATFMDEALYSGDDRLENHVSPETYRLIRRETGAMGIPPELADTERPWLLALSLQALELMKLGYDPRLGVDYHFLSKAKGKKRILELESLDEQIKLLSGFSDREQEMFLLYTLKNLKAMGGQVDSLTRAWATGDTKTVESILTNATTEDESLKRIQERLLDERNAKMALNIESYLSSWGTYFVIVGAGHLVGKKGIVEHLKTKGYIGKQL
jgi:uncharacterized protein YbaP (TraB family)